MNHRIQSANSFKPGDHVRVNPPLLVPRRGGLREGTVTSIASHGMVFVRLGDFGAEGFFPEELQKL